MSIPFSKISKSQTLTQKRLKTEPIYFGVLILILFSTFSETQKLTQKPLFVPKSVKKAQINFYQKTYHTYSGVLAETF